MHPIRGVRREINLIRYRSFAANVSDRRNGSQIAVATERPNSFTTSYKRVTAFPPDDRAARRHFRLCSARLSADQEEKE